jgi:hypothetical protein
MLSRRPHVDVPRCAVDRPGFGASERSPCAVPGLEARRGSGDIQRRRLDTPGRVRHWRWCPKARAMTLRVTITMMMKINDTAAIPTHQRLDVAGQRVDAVENVEDRPDRPTSRDVETVWFSTEAVAQTSSKSAMWAPYLRDVDRHPMDLHHHAVSDAAICCMSSACFSMSAMRPGCTCGSSFGRCSAC